MVKSKWQLNTTLKIIKKCYNYAIYTKLGRIRSNLEFDLIKVNSTKILPFKGNFGSNLNCSNLCFDHEIAFFGQKENFIKVTLENK